MSDQAKCPTPEAALTEAIVCAQAEAGESLYLVEARFGRYTDGSGWHWALQFCVEYSDKGVRDGDEFSRRCPVIIRAWQKKVAEYEEYDKGLCPGGC